MTNAVEPLNNGVAKEEKIQVNLDNVVDLYKADKVSIDWILNDYFPKLRNQVNQLNQQKQLVDDEINRIIKVINLVNQTRQERTSEAIREINKSNKTEIVIQDNKINIVTQESLNK